MVYSIQDIGRQLQRARDNQGLTQRAFAKLAGTDQARISKIENGDIDLRVSSLIELARNLGLEFMLVPRQHVPAVSTIISKRPLSSEEKTLRTTINQLQDLTIRLREHFYDNRDIANLFRIAKELTNFKLQAEDLTPIKKVIEALKRIEKTPVLISTAPSIVDSLRQLRNNRAHDLSTTIRAPRPAYTLEDNG